jgi:hypothetical protein
MPLGRFGTAGQFVSGSATSSRPLYETQPSVPPSIGSASPDTIDESKPVRRLGVRFGDAPGATVFDIGTRAVPYVPPSSIPSPGSPTTLNERFETLLPPTNASPGAASPDDLEAFRRRWLETFMQP